MSRKKVLCCGIIRHEVEHLLAGQNVDIAYIDPALHVDLGKLAQAVGDRLQEMNGNDVSLLIGNECHPGLRQIVVRYGGRVIQAKNCIEMLLGDRMIDLDAGARTFYLTNGWLENWRSIFIEGLGWDAVDARQNFGCYDRIILLDNGILPIDPISVLEFYDYVQVPVETMSVSLDHFDKLLKQLLQR